MPRSTPNCIDVKASAHYTNPSDQSPHNAPLRELNDAVPQAVSLLAQSSGGNDSVLMKTSATAHLRSLDHSGSLTISEALQSVRALVDGLSKSARAVEDRTGVTNAQLFLLQQIRANRHVTVNDLAALAMTTQSTVSIVLSRLERKRLVKRTRSPVDRRSVVLQLTEAGKRLLRRAPQPATSEVLVALGRLTSEELRALLVGLHALGRELGLPIKSPALLFEATGDGVASRTGTKRRVRRRRA